MLGCTVKAPSTLGTFLRSFRWGHVRQLDRAWAAGAGPGDAPLTIDLDSTLCETYGLAKEGARQPGYSGARGYHPLLVVAAGSGDVLMARLREGRAHSGRGAAHFLRETVGAGPRLRRERAGQLTVRADSGFYNHAVVAACRALDVRFPVTIRRQPNVRTLIEAIAEEDWTPRGVRSRGLVRQPSVVMHAPDPSNSAILSVRIGGYMMPVKTGRERKLPVHARQDT